MARDEGQIVAHMELEGLENDMVESFRLFQRRFNRLSTNCYYWYSRLNGCRKIKTPSMHKCCMKNCPLLSQAKAMDPLLDVIEE